MLGSALSYKVLVGLVCLLLRKPKQHRYPIGQKYYYKGQLANDPKESLIKQVSGPLPFRKSERTQWGSWKDLRNHLQGRMENQVMERETICRRKMFNQEIF